jgi:hypothetical protein
VEIDHGLPAVDHAGLWGGVLEHDQKLALVLFCAHLRADLGCVEAGYEGLLFLFSCVSKFCVCIVEYDIWMST